MKKLLLGGSPCTKWSIAQKNREVTNSGEGWELFKNYLIAQQLFQPNYFLYENNSSASSLIKESIENELGFQRVEINSSVVSAQNRARFYISNLPVEVPERSSLCVRDILDKESSETVHTLKHKVENPKPSRLGLIRVGLVNDSDSQGNRVYSINGKSATLCAGSGGLGARTGLYLMDNGDVRKLSTNEARRLQTIPNWFRFNCSNNQIYKQLGNGWTIEVIKLFLKNLPKDEEFIVLSMYDGMSCGQIALKELGLKIKEYIAVEIDKYCQNTIKENFPSTVLFKDAFDVRNKESKLYKYIVK